MPADFAPGQWAVILGGSSGFGLATAQVLAEHGMNLCIVHRDRRSQLAQIEPEFEKLRKAGVSVQTHNTDALAAVKRGAVLDALADALGEGRVRVLLHSIAFGNLKPLAPPPASAARDATQKLAVALESLARSIAVEYAPHGIRCNVIQPGITETPALAAIPGSDQIKAQARMRNPFHRLTTPIDVANAIYLLSLDDAAWMNGAVIRVDGGEHISGVSE